MVGGWGRVGLKGMGCIERDWRGLKEIGWKGIGLGRIGYVLVYKVLMYRL